MSNRHKRVVSDLQGSGGYRGEKSDQEGDAPLDGLDSVGALIALMPPLMHVMMGKKRSSWESTIQGRRHLLLPLIKDILSLNFRCIIYLLCLI